MKEIHCLLILLSIKSVLSATVPLKTVDVKKESTYKDYSRRHLSEPLRITNVTILTRDNETLVTVSSSSGDAEFDNNELENQFMSSPNDSTSDSNGPNDSLIAEETSTVGVPVNAPLVQNNTGMGDPVAFARLREACNESSQCMGQFTKCNRGFCTCLDGYYFQYEKQDSCIERGVNHIDVPKTDPTMIGVVIGLSLMSVTLCVVMRLFAKARFRENRTIFNTANPRLMNVTLKKGSKHGGNRGRRGSQVSVQSGEYEEDSPQQRNERYVDKGNTRVSTKEPPSEPVPTITA